MYSFFVCQPYLNKGSKKANELKYAYPNKTCEQIVFKNFSRLCCFLHALEGETNHERLWTLKNKLRVLEGRGVGGWVSLVMGIKEGRY